MEHQNTESEILRAEETSAAGGNIQFGAIFHQGGNIPPIHRAVNLVGPHGLRESADYILVNRSTNLIKYFEPEEIALSPDSVQGISVLVLADDLRDIEGRHGVLHSHFMDACCFTSCALENGLGLVVQHDQRLRMRGSPKGSGFHCVIVPLEPMTLETLVAKFSSSPNWQVCRPAAGGLSTSVCEREDEDVDRFDRIPLVGLDKNISKLAKLLNGFGRELDDSILRLAIVIRRAIMSLEVKVWSSLMENEDIALSIYVFLYHLNDTVDPLKEDSAIFVEYLLNDVEEMLQLGDEWEVVDIRDKINSSLYYRSLATEPCVLVYFKEYSMENVSDSHLAKLISDAGFMCKAIPAQSVILAFPLDDERAREKLIHLIKRAHVVCSDDGPVSVCFGAQSAYDDDDSSIILLLDHWDLCTDSAPPTTVVMRDFDSIASPKQHCSDLSKSGVRCKRMTYHESGRCWQHRIDKK